MDANAKVGYDIIQGDPHPQSQNGNFLVDLGDRNGLIICNATDKCNGLITRKRITISRIE